MSLSFIIDNFYRKYSVILVRKAKCFAVISLLNAVHLEIFSVDEWDFKDLFVVVQTVCFEEKVLFIFGHNT